MLTKIYIAVIAIGLILSVPHLEGSMFIVVKVLLGLYIIWMLLQYTMMYKKIKLTKYLYVRSTHFMIELAIYTILASQIHWIWATQAGITVLVIFAHLRVATSDPDAQKKYLDATGILSDKTINELDQWGRWIPRTIFRMDKPEPLTAFWERFTK